MNKEESKGKRPTNLFCLDIGWENPEAFAKIVKEVMPKFKEMYTGTIIVYGTVNNSTTFQDFNKFWNYDEYFENGINKESLDKVFKISKDYINAEIEISCNKVSKRLDKWLDNLERRMNNNFRQCDMNILRKTYKHESI